MAPRGRRSQPPPREEPQDPPAPPPAPPRQPAPSVVEVPPVSSLLVAELLSPTELGKFTSDPVRAETERLQETAILLDRASQHLAHAASDLPASAAHVAAAIACITEGKSQFPLLVRPPLGPRSLLP